MGVDSFKFLPRLIAVFYQMMEVEARLPIPWTPLPAALSDCTVGLITSAGLYNAALDTPFNTEREKREPTWGDPGFRRIPKDIPPADLAISHLHINTADILRDPGIVFPLGLMQELVGERRIGGLADENYSFMGFQGYPPNTQVWEQDTGPQVAEAFIDAGVQCVLLTPV